METNWEINKEALYQYKESWASDYFTVTEDEKYGVLIYNIREGPMGAYSALLAIYDKSNLIEPIINLKDYKVWYQGKYSYYYMPISKCIVFFVYSSNKRLPKATKSPFLFLDLEKKKYALLPWDFTSISYAWREISENNVQLYEESPKTIKMYNKYEGILKAEEILNLNDLNWKDI